MAKSKLADGTPTIFIKQNRYTKKVEGTWEGTVRDFAFSKDGKGRETVEFKFKLDRQIECPREYANTSVGWHLDEGTMSGLAVAEVKPDMFPAFFSRMNETQDWNEFEKDCYKLLKLLGIHEIHTFVKQRGKPDGFFKIGSLAVIYDATLDSDFIVTKRDQMKNYSGQLSSGLLEYEDGTINVRDCLKSVWIVTQGASRRITKMDNVTVKEVSVAHLMEIYRNRVERNLSEDQLVRSLEAVAQ